MAETALNIQEYQQQRAVAQQEVDKKQEEAQRLYGEWQRKQELYNTADAEDFARWGYEPGGYSRARENLKRDYQRARDEYQNYVTGVVKPAQSQVQSYDEKISRLESRVGRRRGDYGSDAQLVRDQESNQLLVRDRQTYYAVPERSPPPRVSGVNEPLIAPTPTTTITYNEGTATFTGDRAIIAAGVGRDLQASSERVRAMNYSREVFGATAAERAAAREPVLSRTSTEPYEFIGGDVQPGKVTQPGFRTGFSSGFRDVTSLPRARTSSGSEALGITAGVTSRLAGEYGIGTGAGFFGGKVVTGVLKYVPKATKAGKLLRVQLGVAGVAGAGVTGYAGSQGYLSPEQMTRTTGLFYGFGMSGAKLPDKSPTVSSRADPFISKGFRIKQQSVRSQGTAGYYWSAKYAPREPAFSMWTGQPEAVPGTSRPLFQTKLGYGDYLKVAGKSSRKLWQEMPEAQVKRLGKHQPKPPPISKLRRIGLDIPAPPVEAGVSPSQSALFPRGSLGNIPSVSQMQARGSLKWNYAPRSRSLFDYSMELRPARPRATPKTRPSIFGRAGQLTTFHRPSFARPSRPSFVPRAVPQSPIIRGVSRAGRARFKTPNFARVFPATSAGLFSGSVIGSAPKRVTAAQSSLSIPSLDVGLSTAGTSATLFKVGFLPDMRAGTAPKYSYSSAQDQRSALKLFSATTAGSSFFAPPKFPGISPKPPSRPPKPPGVPGIPFGFPSFSPPKKRRGSRKGKKRTRGYGYAPSYVALLGYKPTTKGDVFTGIEVRGVRGKSWLA